jgi:hypothetical protein
MMERPARTTSSKAKSSETDPPAANQPLHDKKAAQPTQSDTTPADRQRVDPAPEVVPGKPDGEVDTRS